MSEFNFQRPLDPEAIKQANEVFYYHHPEMVVQGKRQPIYPLDRKHEAYRDEWEYTARNRGDAIGFSMLILANLASRKKQYLKENGTAIQAKFKSENIWFDPSDYINTESIKILIEKDNPEKYYVDTSFLPKTSG